MKTPVEIPYTRQAIYRHNSPARLVRITENWTGSYNETAHEAGIIARQFPCTNKPKQPAPTIKSVRSLLRAACSATQAGWQLTFRSSVVFTSCRLPRQSIRTPALQQQVSLPAVGGEPPTSHVAAIIIHSALPASSSNTRERTSHAVGTQGPEQHTRSSVCSAQVPDGSTLHLDQDSITSPTLQAHSLAQAA